MSYDAVPDELKQRPQWVIWRFEQGETVAPIAFGGATKIPYNPRSGRRASSTNPDTWTTYEIAVKAAQARNFAGVGYVFSPDDPYTGIDLDDCRSDDGTIAPWAQVIVDDMQSYTEISPSGHGLKIWVEGTIPTSVKQPYADGKIEMYDRARYFTVTGEHLETTPRAIRNVNGALTQLYDHLRPAPKAPEPLPTSTRPADTSEHAQTWARRVLSRAIEMVTLAVDGHKDDTLLAAAMLAAGALPHITEDEITTALYAAISGRAADPRHAQQTIRNGIRYGDAKRLDPPPAPPQPEYDTAGFACCPIHHRRLPRAKNGNGYKCRVKDRSTATGWCTFWWAGEGYIEPRMAADALPGGTSSGDAQPDAAASESAVAASPARRVPILLRATELHLLPPAIPLIPDVLYVNTLHQFFGAPGSGKSLLALDIACTVAQMYTVVYVAAEAIEDYEARINAWTSHYQRSVENVYFWREPLRLGDDRAVQQFILAIETIGPALILFDPLADCMTGLDESNAEDMGVAIAALNEIRRASSAAIGIVHHTGWNDERERGSSKLRGACRIVARVEMRDDGVIRFTCVKKNQGEKFRPRLFRLVASGTMDSVLPLPAYMVMPGKPTLNDRMLRVMEALITEPLREGATHAQLMADTQIPAGTLNRVLTALVEASYVKAGDDTRSRKYKLTIDGQDALNIALEEGGEIWKNKAQNRGSSSTPSFNWFILSSNETGLSDAPSSKSFHSSSTPEPPSSTSPPAYISRGVEGLGRETDGRPEDEDDSDQASTGSELFAEVPVPTIPPPTERTTGFDSEYARKMLAGGNTQALLMHYRLNRRVETRGLTNEDVLEFAERELGDVE